MWKSSSERISDLQTRLASLQLRVSSYRQSPSGYVDSGDDYLDLKRYGDMRNASDKLSHNLTRVSTVKVDATGTPYASFTGAQMKKELIEAFENHTSKREEAFRRQNERLSAEIAQLTGTGKRISKAKQEEIRRAKRKLIGEESFTELEERLNSFKKIKISKRGSVFTVKK